MPIGYLIIVTFVAFALAQPRRPRPLAILSWLSAPVFNELPLLAGLALAAGTVSGNRYQ